MLVCYHGSWNRSVPTGYKMVLFKLDEGGNAVSSEDFITGWLQSNGQPLGRPVAVSTTSDGRIYITDDYAGLVYVVEKIVSP